ncbi:phage integrase SAM-like domain-containing protein [Bacteroides stercorirosoris]|jgi:site-specific recombinase XerD|uniref:Site-specific recombinase XerD n=1 Tax=Bacteroides stercorirosoris TaxID=871324 RepID=A0A1M6KXC3_9BACE|nr:phage integrase SAM-like domain-containing protein [Bacteroides stercorirosoris]OKZ10104.1 MAG: recombinase [Bacteroides oleiciplenus]SHJ63526.1 Site-specific recombinase XerD [Bacteroides stercorirosoris]
MANLSIVIVPTKKLSNGKHRIRIAVAHRSQTRYISTQFILDSANQMKNGKVVRHENAANINTCLRKIIYEYEEILSSIHYLPTLSCTELIHTITREQQKKGITFNTVANEYLSYMKTEEQKKSYKLYSIACRKIQKYMKGDFPLIQLSPLQIQGFANEMKEEGLSATSVRIYLTLIKVILNYAGKMNYVNYPVHPFVLFKMPVSNVRELDLTVEELKSIRDVKLFKTTQVMVRDIFMLTYYLGGINLRDLMEYDFKNRNHMRYVRHKTRNSKKSENEIAFTIQPEAQEIINKYITDNGKLVFGRYSSYEKVYSLVFRHINKVANLAGINRKVSYYSARKTFAQHGYDMGIEIEKIEYCIGHSMKNNRPIFNYIRIMQEHADKVFRAILDQLIK